MRDRKEKLSQAKAMVISGDSLKEASRKTGLSMDILKKQSSKENWLQLQDIYFQNMTRGLINQYGDEHIKIRGQAIETLSKVLKLTIEETQKGEIDSKKIKVYENIIDVVKKAAEGQAQLLELPNVKDFYNSYYMGQDLELKKEKLKGLKGNLNKTNAFLDKLDEFLI